MADNVIANPGVGGATFRAINRSSVFTPVSVIDGGGEAGPELLIVAGQTTMANSLPVAIASNQGNVPVSQATASNLNAQVVGAVASAGANSGNPLKTGGVFNTTQPTVTNAQIVDAQYSAHGAAIVSTGVDTFTVTVGAAIPSGGNTIGAVTQASGPWTANITQLGSSALALGQTTMANSVPVTLASNQSNVGITGTVTANIGTTNGLALDASINGVLVAQGSTTSGEKGPLIQGAVTTSAPSYTTAQTSPLSLTTAGLLRVDASGATVSITANSSVNLAQVGGSSVALGQTTMSASLPVTIASNQSALSVSQSGAPWSDNITQFGGVNVSTGTGAGGTGIPRVTVSNDSQVKLWDGTNTEAVKAAQTSPLLADPAGVVAISPNNTGLPVNVPVIVQKTNNVSSGSVASLAKAFGSNNFAGNSIVVVCAVGNGTAPTVSDSAGNTYTQATQVANGTAFNVAIFSAVNILSGANTVTVTNGGSTASIAMEIYEISGLITQKVAQPDITATGTGSTSPATSGAIAPSNPNELAFAGIGLGTAAQTITVGSGWTNDSGQQNPTTPAGLFSFVSMSQFLEDLVFVNPQATFTNEPWAIAVATFTPVVMGITGQVSLVPCTQGQIQKFRLLSLATTNGNNVKAGPGQIYKLVASNNNASPRYVKLYNKASAPTVGTDTPVDTIELPGNASGCTVAITYPQGNPFPVGISFAITGGITDSDTTAVGTNDVALNLHFY